MAKRKRLEGSIEDAVVGYAKSKGVICRKMNGMGNRSWPDRMFLYKGTILFIEFKRQGLLPTPLQANMMEQLQKAGFSARCADSVELGRVIINDWLSGHSVNDWQSLVTH